MVLLVHHKLEAQFDRFWALVERGEIQSGYKGFVQTFGSRLTILKKNVYDATEKVVNWASRESFNLPPYSVVVVCLPDIDVETNYYELKKAVMLQGPRAQLLFASTLERPSPGFIAVGLATAIYAKAGGTPWRLLDPSAPGGLFLGLGFAMGKENNSIYYGVVEVYDRFGKLIEAHAQTYDLPFSSNSSEGLFIPTASLSQILGDIQTRLRPLSLIVHKSGPFHREELAAFDGQSVPQGLVHLELSNPYRLYDIDDQKFAAFRGLLASDGEDPNRGIMLTTGNVNDTFVQRHALGTPRIHRSECQKEHCSIYAWAIFRASLKAHQIGLEYVSNGRAQADSQFPTLKRRQGSDLVATIEPSMILGILYNRLVSLMALPILAFSSVAFLSNLFPPCVKLDN